MSCSWTETVENIWCDTANSITDRQINLKQVSGQALSSKSKQAGTILGSQIMCYLEYVHARRNSSVDFTFVM